MAHKKTTKAFNNDKPIRIVDVTAIRLVKKRASKENRTFANAAAQTIIEALSGINAHN